MNRFEERLIAAHIYRVGELLASHQEALFLANAYHAKGDEESAVREIERAESYRDELTRRRAANSRTVER